VLGGLLRDPLGGWVNDTLGRFDGNVLRTSTGVSDGLVLGASLEDTLGEIL